MDWSRDKFFERQIMQHNAALYYKVPIRELKVDISDSLYTKLKLQYSRKEFYDNISKYLLDIFNFNIEYFNNLYNSYITNSVNLNDCFVTFYSNYPNLFRELNNSKKFYFYTLLIIALLAYRSKKIKKIQSLEMFNMFKLLSYRVKDRIYLTGR